MRRLLTVALLAVAFPAAAPGGCVASAQEGTAGLVIQFSDADVREWCVALDGDDADGVALVRATGLDHDVQDFGGGNLAICRIDGVGCAYPGEECFCRCANPDAGCTFWGVYVVDERGRWSFPDVGLSQLRIEPGTTLGLRWGEQTPDGGNPPGSDPEGLCARATPVSLRASAQAGRGGVPVGGIAAIAGLVVALGAAAALVRRARRAP